MSKEHQGPALHPNCPVCNSTNTKEVLLAAYLIPHEFAASTDYACLDCHTLWVTGDYVLKWKDAAINHKEGTQQ